MPFVNPYPNPFTAATPQLVYQNNFNPPTSGSVADTADVQDFITAIAPSANLVFGCLAVIDSSVTTTLGGGIGQGAKHPAASGDITGGVLGIVLKSAAMETRRDGLPPSYNQGDPVNIMRVGRLYAASESGAAPHDPVYARITANSGNGCIQLGALSNQADGSNNVLLSNCKWLDTIAPGGVGRVEVNFLGQ